MTKLRIALLAAVSLLLALPTAASALALRIDTRRTGHLRALTNPL